MAFFLESMKDVNGVRQPNEIDNTINAGFIPDTEYFDALPYGRHGFEVVWLLATLNFIELITGLANIARKITKTVE